MLMLPTNRINFSNSMKLHHNPQALRIASRRGFSLVELLVVVGVIAMLMVLSAPTMSAAFKGSKLTQGGELFRNLITQGRQVALKNNAPVEVRIYKYDDVDTPETTMHYMAARLYLMKLDLSTNADPLTTKLVPEATGNVVKLPAGIIISDDATQSSLTNPSRLITGHDNVKGLDPDVAETSADYVGFQIRPDGSLNLSTNQRWFLTLYNREEIIKGTQTSPSDYVCLQVNPYTCEVRWYHPN
jgi:uncharacterized protein (TIGR02596 family)